MDKVQVFKLNVNFNNLENQLWMSKIVAQWGVDRSTGHVSGEHSNRSTNGERKINKSFNSIENYGSLELQLHSMY